MIGTRKTALTAVSELLADQKTALLNGDLDRLGKMEELLGRAVKRLQSGPVSHEDLARVREQAGRNAELLRAAQVGVARAQAQIAARTEDGFTTYDAHGQSQASSAPNSRTLARR